ncbi:hypothetical protein EJ06DRAFT_240603 [Trichodelitschia bisporula]|uniref:Heterokaryon incompatibility domain-containing protein n=1 Tax=Trichodelitschia bisporula TaxID=703511 RepID=A0A6G1HKD6_9PEZI|nr:hypothetical protein EJ06DRAFT_240603 [Trichodelitschia bisporula]
MVFHRPKWLKGSKLEEAHAPPIYSLPPVQQRPYKASVQPVRVQETEEQPSTTNLRPVGAQEANFGLSVPRHGHQRCNSASSDLDAIPQAEAEARKHIAKIRAEKGLDGTDSNTADLQAALVVLSEQLYQKSTHFLLELVQNADDNAYNVPKPTLNITYEKRTLRIDCNEVGFAKKNVEAICRIGRSSKAGLDNSRRYIGEKGIGFKSVFRVSDVVSIFSNHYSFKFDKSQRLGMIAPIWEKFPAKTLPGYTSILLQLSQDCDVEELIQEIKSLDPRLLIFLQKLRQINILIKRDDDLPWRSALERLDEPTINKKHQLITLHHRSKVLPYLIFRLQVGNLPKDPKREGISQSELLLAFPLDGSGQPRIEPQNVYAFLPVRDYGFKFLLQADFLLIASREDINSSADWNQALLQMVPLALHDAIKEFNSGNMRYSWLPYLPLRPYVGDFFKGLEDHTLDVLQTSAILESFDNRLMIPGSLIYVPAKFADTDGKPLILTKRTMAKYLSHKYSANDWYRLSHLGVRSLTIDGFIDDLSSYILDDPASFQKQPDAWHSRLAQVLVSQIFSNKAYQAAIATLQIVPLRDGGWAAPAEVNLLFPSRSKALVLPKGLDIVEIHPRAETDNPRRQLFMALGAKEFQKEQICDIITRSHEKREFQPEKLTTEELVSQIVFLYQSGWRNADRRDVWFATESGKRCHGSQAYMDSDVEYAANSVFSESRGQLSFLHGDYYKAFQVTVTSDKVDATSKSEDWEKWLAAHMNVAQIPRLATPSIGAPFSLSKEFEQLLNTLSSTELLLLVRHHWKYYSRWIAYEDSRVKKSVWEISQGKLKKKLSSIQVMCRDGTMAPLNKTFLPLSSMQLESFVSVPFLDVPEPDDDRWDFLRHFGVIVELDAAFFIECVRRLKDGQTTQKQVSQLYEQISLWATRDNADSIRRTFDSQKLILIPDDSNESGGEWVSIEECIWSGPKCLKSTHCLERHYPEHQALLRDMLRVGDANINTLVSEARCIVASDSLEYISQVFIALSKYLELANSDSAVRPLVACPIFPVTTGKSNSEYDSLATAAPDDMWFVADRSHLRDSFELLVPLLAFGIDVVEKIGPLIDSLDMERRMLSKVAKGVSKAHGRVEIDPKYTKSLRQKARFIARLVPKESANRAGILRLLPKIEVYQSEKVLVEWVVTLSGNTFYGRADAGRVTSSPGKLGLKIFLTEEDIHAALPPLELQEELANFSEIRDPKHFTILLYILMQNDFSAIGDTFERRGISGEVPEFDAASGGADDGAEPLIRPSKPQEAQRNRRLLFKGRRRPVKDHDSEDALSSFIKKVERVVNLKKSSAEPWGSTDMAGLLSKICKVENRDADILLPRPRLELGDMGDPVESMFDARTGQWKEMVIHPDDPTAASKDGQGPATDYRRVPDVDEETRYIGELSVSKLFESYLGGTYDPNVHWTSPLRGKAGHMPYENCGAGASTFTISSQGEMFTKFLAKRGFLRAASWTTAPAYHIHVVSTYKGLQSTFLLDPTQVEKAQKSSMLRDSGTSPKAVFILVSVFKITSDPGIALFVDPWQLHVNGSLSLLSRTPYYAAFQDASSAILLQGTVDAPEPQPSAEGVRKVSKTMQHGGKAAAETQRRAMSKDGYYTYRPLRNHREIRLLELYPGKDDQPLEGAIRHVSVDKPGVYWALSYCWGAALQPFTFVTPDGKIPLTASLQSALTGIRDADVSTLLWADAICIDQDTALEKCTQIRLMYTIFQSAEGVIAWLGDERDGSDRVIETLLQIRTLAIKPDIWPEYLPAVPVSWDGGNMPPATDTVWRDIDRLLNRAWFRRAWIVQELILASAVSLFCGRWAINWDDFFEALKLCRAAAHDPGHPLLPHSDAAYALGQARHMHALTPRPLLTLLDLFAYTNATRSRDKLFALLALAPDAASSSFDPDYTSPLEAVLRRYAATFVVQGHALSLLQRAGTGKSYPFASWIPAWTVAAALPTLATWRGMGGTFCAGGSGVQRGEVRDVALVVRGVVLDEVASVVSPRSADVDVISWINGLRKAVLDLRSYPSGESRADVARALPIGAAAGPVVEPPAGKVPGILTGTASAGWASWPKDYTKLVERAGVGSVGDMVSFLKRPPAEREVVWNYWQTAGAFEGRFGSAGAVGAVLGKGWVGVLNAGVEKGDQVVLLEGAACPLVLRGEGESWRVVGEGYVHGIMYGERWEKEKGGREFVLV